MKQKKENKNSYEKCISNNITLCKSLLKKGTGLMFKRKKQDFAYIFPFKKKQIMNITMMFVFFPIDIIFLVKNNENDRLKIVEIVENLKPFTHYIAKEKSTTFIELPIGSVKKHKLKLGSELEIKNKKLFLITKKI